MSDSEPRIRSRSVTAAGDMSTCLLRNPRASSWRETSRNRAVTALGPMSTTANLLEALDVRDVLRPCGRELQGYQALARYDADAATLEAGREPARPDGFERPRYQQHVQHERLAVDQLRESLHRDAAREVHRQGLQRETTGARGLAQAVDVIRAQKQIDGLGGTRCSVDGESHA